MTRPLSVVKLLRMRRTRVPITFSFEPETITRLKVMAKNEKISRSALVERLMLEGLETRERLKRLEENPAFKTMREKFAEKRREMMDMAAIDWIIYQAAADRVVGNVLKSEAYDEPIARAG